MRKGISTERTFRNISKPEELEAKAKQISESLAAYMAKENLKGKVLTLKLKPVTFDTFTRAVTLPNYISTSDEIFASVLEPLRKEYPLNIRLMGIRMSTLIKDGVLVTDKSPEQKSVTEFFANNTADQGGDNVSSTAQAYSTPATQRSTAVSETPIVPVKKLSGGCTDIASFFSKDAIKAQKSFPDMKEKLQQLVDMGFTDTSLNEEALESCGGRVENAIERLIQGSQPSSSDSLRTLAPKPSAGRMGASSSGHPKRRKGSTPSIESMLSKKRKL
mmetsp:Transcript_39759/g.62075  ORF Transcript_39759/g.62075 Transcript_39759/m.62075 type:complete len:275 (+) Transcript_39759:726-1550(+)